MNEAGIGVFDSGLGGLTVVRSLLEVLPSEHLIYLGDTARVPYGTKSPQTVLKYCIDNVLFLVSQGVKAIVIACNTASAHALIQLQSLFRIPIIGVIEAGAKIAAYSSLNGQIAVLATRGTVASGAYERTIHNYRRNARVHSVSCPLFVSLVEEGYIHRPATQCIISDYLSPLLQQDIDTVLLGCTHFPLLAPLIADALPPHTLLVDAAESCAKEVKTVLERYRLLNPSDKRAECSYYVTDDPARFASVGKQFLGKDLERVELCTS